MMQEASMKKRQRDVGQMDGPELVAASGLLNRRMFLEAIAVAGAAGVSDAAAEPLTVPQWSKQPGAPFAPYSQPSHFEDNLARATPAPPNPATVGIGTARTPLHLLDGMMAPSGLHFERSQAGIPDIDPDRHRL